MVGCGCKGPKRQLTVLGATVLGLKYSVMATGPGVNGTEVPVASVPAGARVGVVTTPNIDVGVPGSAPTGASGVSASGGAGAGAFDVGCIPNREC